MSGFLNAEEQNVSFEPNSNKKFKLNNGEVIQHSADRVKTISKTLNSSDYLQVSTSENLCTVVSHILDSSVRLQPAEYQLETEPLANLQIKFE